MNNIIEILKKEFCQSSGIDVKENFLLSEYTSFKTGGCADGAVFVSDTVELSRLMRIIKNEKYCILGNASNVLFPDEGYHGIVIITSPMKEIEVLGNTIIAQSGIGLTNAAVYALKNGLSGLEFAFGIPGSMGGAVYMNAGAYDGEMAQIVTSSEYMTPDGKISVLDRKSHEFSYRHSAYSDSDKIILSCTMEFEPKESGEIKIKMDENMNKRRDKQPLEYPSAGSVFKRPQENFAGKLISDSGLKGYRIGGAEVSQKHAGFIINKGGATTRDILNLIDFIKEKVYKDHSVALECEVRYIC